MSKDTAISYYIFKLFINFISTRREHSRPTRGGNFQNTIDNSPSVMTQLVVTKLRLPTNAVYLYSVSLFFVLVLHPRPHRR